MPPVEDATAESVSCLSDKKFDVAGGDSESDPEQHETEKSTVSNFSEITQCH